MHLLNRIANILQSPIIYSINSVMYVLGRCRRYFSFPLPLARLLWFHGCEVLVYHQIALPYAINRRYVVGVRGRRQPIIPAPVRPDTECDPTKRCTSGRLLNNKYALYLLTWNRLLVGVILIFGEIPKQHFTSVVLYIRWEDRQFFGVWEPTLW
mgnify:CR=1 FL=1